MLYFIANRLVDAAAIAMRCRPGDLVAMRLYDSDPLVWWFYFLPLILLPRRKCLFSGRSSELMKLASVYSPTIKRGRGIYISVVKILARMSITYSKTMKHRFHAVDA